MSKKHVFGPVLSRRLGYSLGVDIIPHKVCTLDCIYCQVGRTTLQTVKRNIWVETAHILPELKKAIAEAKKVDCITFSGSGEPTLNYAIGEMIKLIKTNWQIPVVVLTNATLLYREDVRRDLMQADIVVPSMDAVSPDIFRAINRPHHELVLEHILDGLKIFSREFKGRLWLEVMLVKGVNDMPSALKGIADAAAAIQHDKFQINTVVRPPAVDGTGPVSRNVLEQALDLFGKKAEIISDQPAHRAYGSHADLQSAILQLVSRRPCSVMQISLSLAVDAESVRLAIEKLLGKKRIKKVVHGHETYYARPVTDDPLVR